MRPIKTYLISFAFAFLLVTVGARADVVETKNGARLVGTVVSIDGTSLLLDTEYAGQLTIKQKEVVSVTTEKSLNVRLSSGTVLQGTLSGIGNGAILLSGPDGTLQTSVEKLSATWAPGGVDPAVSTLR